MGKNIVKIALLMVLVVLCIWQIVILWLGDMSSHNFLVEKNTKEHVALVQPKAVWVNTSKAIYKVDESQNEYRMLINELSSFVVSDVKSTPIQNENSITYEGLLEMPGIIYEFDLPVGLAELMGDVLNKSDDKITVDQIFIDLSDYNDDKTNFYLTSEDKKSIYKITAYGRIEGHKKMLERFNDTGMTDELVRYQPSMISDKKQQFRRNSFMPFNTKKVPIEYDVLKVSNPIEENGGKEKTSILERFVNSFFSNPLLKEIDYKSDGSIIFSENMRASVKYDIVGTLEFKVASASKDAELTNVERLAKVMKFIRECSGVPDFLKQGIYLSKITNEDGQYTYGFDYKYNGFGVQLSNSVQKKLGIENILVITVKNDQIVSGKWSILEIQPFGEKETFRSKLQRSYGEIVDEMYGHYISKEKGGSKLDKVECRYIMNTIDGRMNLEWVALYKNKWYCP